MIIPRPYADLYEIDAGDSSSFTVNDNTDRVQSAIWNEAGSKSQNEIITLDQCRAIAEAFAKEKYSELWNVSETRGIKLTRNETLDRGVDRQLCFEWTGVLYGSSGPGGQRIEILDVNEISITVSPYTGHILDYNEVYVPSVFTQNALTDLTSIVTEEKANEIAITEFESLEANVNQEGDIQSLGLVTIVDENNTPILTWAFQTERSEPRSKETIYVNVDAMNGDIAWSTMVYG